MSKVIIAGGTGSLGKLIEKRLQSDGHDVFILTRSSRAENHVQWDPKSKSIALENITDAEFLINLCGEGIADKRWTSARIQELYDSRLIPMKFLAELSKDKLPNLKSVVCFSGIDCYPLTDSGMAIEEEAYGNYTIANLVRAWEEEMDHFKEGIPVSKIRLAPVLHPNFGMLKKLVPLIKFKILSPLGSGQQQMNWVHFEDAVEAAVFSINKQLRGPYNVCGLPVSNKAFTTMIMKAYGNKVFFPPIPRFLLRLLLGEMSDVLVKGRAATSEKLLNEGFKMKFMTLHEAVEEISDGNT